MPERSFRPSFRVVQLITLCPRWRMQLTYACWKACSDCEARTAPMPRPPAAPPTAAPRPGLPNAAPIAAPAAAPTSPPVTAPRTASCGAWPDTWMASWRHSSMSRLTFCALELLNVSTVGLQVCCVVHPAQSSTSAIPAGHDRFIARPSSTLRNSHDGTRRGQNSRRTLQPEDTDAAVHSATLNVGLPNRRRRTRPSLLALAWAESATTVNFGGAMPALTSGADEIRAAPRPPARR